VGFEVEGKPFRPHITLARVRSALETDRRKLLARTAKKVDFTASVPVSELTLFESVLAPGGSRYRRLHVATLKGGR
jgi:2'-5' RNA ligase